MIIRYRLKLIIFYTALLNLSSHIAYANPFLPEKKVESAQLLKAESLSDVASATAKHFQVSAQVLKQNQILTEQLLNNAIEIGDVSLMQYLLPIYRSFPQSDSILILFAEAQIAKKQGYYHKAIRLYQEILSARPELTPVRTQLAISLFITQQDNAASDQFKTILSDSMLPADIKKLVLRYQEALVQRNRWQISLGADYLREKNINNASSDRYIEKTAFVKNESMLPQRAQGIGYFFAIERNFNLTNSHYLHLENSLYGKTYWDNHDFDDITNRLYLGYVHKNEHQRIAILPFYEQQWYGGHRYKRETGIRMELNRWLNSHWQISTALEYGQNFYSNNLYLNGKSKLASSSLFWRPMAKYSFYSGLDFYQERTKIRHHSYDLITARLGWEQEWDWGVVSRLSLSISKRQYKDHLSLGSVFHFDKSRKDVIYQLHLTAWKKDWHFWGITPKVHYRWKKQRSNFESLYSYSDKNLTLLFEKSF